MWWKGELAEVKAERDWLRKEYAYLKGKCERLELALLQPRGVETFAEQERPAAIEQVKIEQPGRKTAWQSTKDWWNGLSEEEQTKLLDGGMQ